jgi:surfeit locus 1 family protein
MPLSFRFRLIPLLATVAICALGINLALWQGRRAIEKEQIAMDMHQRAALPPVGSNDLSAIKVQSDLVFRRVSVQGKFIQEWPIYLDNRPLHGVAGFYVLMPFKITNSDRHLLVVRGWQPRNPIDRTRMSVLKTPGKEIILNGIIRSGVDRVMQLGQPDVLRPGQIVQNIDIVALSKKTDLNLFDLVVEQTSELSDGLQRDWPVPSAGADKHRAYQFQWYALSLMAIIFFVVTGFRREKNG